MNWVGEIWGWASRAMIGAVFAHAFASDAIAAGHQLPVPKATIYPGETIGGDMVVERLFSSNFAAKIAVYETRGALIGKVARRTLLPGQPVPVNAVRDPYVITQGQPVMVILEVGGLTITGYAVPLQSGSPGDVISARNSESGVVIKGAVQADGTLRVDGP